MIPDRLTSPIVGLISDQRICRRRHTTEPSVSVPIRSRTKIRRRSDTLSLNSSRTDFCLTHKGSLFVHRVHSTRWTNGSGTFRSLTQICFPENHCASLSQPLSATKASRVGFEPMRAIEPAVVCMRSSVSMLSFINMGMPCKGPTDPPSLRSRSILPAIESASRLSSITEFRFGPSLSM